MLELFFPSNKPYKCLSLICVLCSTKKGEMGLIFLILRTILHLKNNYSEPVAHWHCVLLLTPKYSLNMLLLVSGDGWGVWRQRNRLKSNITSYQRVPSCCEESVTRLQLKALPVYPKGLKILSIFTPSGLVLTDFWVG